jgi:hypothetical protein
VTGPVIRLTLGWGRTGRHAAATSESRRSVAAALLKRPGAIGLTRVDVESSVPNMKAVCGSGGGSSVAEVAFKLKVQ